MEVERYDNATERSILESMIRDPKALEVISPRWIPSGLFSSPWCNDVGQWCVDYHQKYGTAPGEEIVSLFRSWAIDCQDEERVRMMDRFLDGLDFQTPRQSNSLYTIDNAGEYFNKVKLTRHWEEIRSAIARGELARAEDLITKYSRVELGSGAGVHLLQDEQAVASVFDSNVQEPLVTYPGAVGNFFRDYLGRGCFIAFLAPTKVGKTTWLVDLAYRALCKQKRVGFFSIGDETAEQLYRRFVVRICGLPIQSTNRDGSWPCTINKPSWITPPPEKSKAIADVDHDPWIVDKPLDKKTAWKTIREIDRDFNKESYLQISVHGNLSVTVLDVRGIVDSWSRNGWVPDVIVIDYADNLSAIDKKEETRDRINTTWKLLRAFSMDKHILLVTATQTKVEGYKADWLSRQHFADDRRKADIVTGMVGINQNVKEKKKGIFRLNWVALRGGDFHEEEGVYVASCLPIANPCMKSTW